LPEPFGRRGKQKKASSYFLQKRTKKLLFIGRYGCPTRTPNGPKFLLLFSKRSAFFLSMHQPQGNYFLSCPGNLDCVSIQADRIISAGAPNRYPVPAQGGDH
jgi:hypothetical protein